MGERINNFLNKKPWHPSSFQNQEKVWIAEQAAAKEEAKIRIRMEEIRREKEAEDLRSVGPGGWVLAQEVRDAKFERVDAASAPRKRGRADDGGSAAAATAAPKPDAGAATAADAKRKADNYAKRQRKKERKARKKAEAADAAAAPTFANDGSFLEQARAALLAKQQEPAAEEGPSNGS